MRKSEIINFPVNIGRYAEFLEEILVLAENGQSSYVCVANVHMLVEANNDRDFLAVIRSADLVTPDGVPLTWALRLLQGIKQDRVAGMNILPDLLSTLGKHGLPVFFYGGTQGVLDNTLQYISANYSNIIVAGSYSPPFRNLDNNEESAIIDLINRSGCKVIFVVLGCPKQEKWMEAMKGRINAVMIGIGGALPVLVGVQKRAPLWMQKVGLEWFFRLCQEPGRLFKRYAITNTTFLWLLGKEVFKKHILRLNSNA